MDPTNLAFPIQLYKALPKRGNLFIAPANIWMCLSMAAIGGRHNTRDQMNDVLGLTHLNDLEVALKLQQMAESIHSISKSGDVEFSTAGRIYAEKSNEFVVEFLALMRRLAGIDCVDFVHMPEKVRAEINAWVAARTKYKITELLPSGSVTENSLMILVTAIYFKGDWLKKFDAKDTVTENFFAPGGPTSIPMMHQSGEHIFGYVLGDNFEGALLPYVGDRLSMVLLMPKEGMSVQEFENELTPARLAATLDLVTKRAGNLQIAMPKYQVDSGIMSLKEALSEIGMPDAFENWIADFTGIDSAGRVYIDNVYHRATGIVNEDGSELTGGTGANMTREAFMLPTVVRFDRPYIYLVFDRKTGTIHFMGRNETPEN